MSEEELRRMNNESLNGLLSWKRNMDSCRDTKLFNQQKYDMLLEEIKKREEKGNVTDEITRRFIALCEELASEYGKKEVDRVLNVLPDVIRMTNAKKSARRNF